MIKTAIFGLLKPDLDAHTMGVFALGESLSECGFLVHYSTQEIALATQHLKHEANKEKLAQWIAQHNITHLGISYRLDKEDALDMMHHVMATLQSFKLHTSLGGTVAQVYFAGLPVTCQLIQQHYPTIMTFQGYESIAVTLTKMGVDPDLIPSQYVQGAVYDDVRLQLAKRLINEQNYKKTSPNPTHAYNEYGTRKDHLLLRLTHHQVKESSPLFRVHVGPYGADRKEAVQLFDEWLQQLKKTRFVDIVSIGTSQLTQSHFEQDWTGLANGGGVPIHNRLEYQQLYDRSRPLLLRTYAGTSQVDQLAQIHEETINITWHALSLWWFNQLDGRGPNDLLVNLKQHEAVLKYIAATNKPFEANVAHHFAFRGGDDTTYVVSTVLAAMLAKKHKVQTFIFQNMLNTPRYTFGVMDVAKAQATLALLKELEDEQFKVIYQPRAGLDYFAPDLELAKAQLAAVSMMMDDVEPDNPNSPPIVHVVSYSEAVFLATPPIIDESIQITKTAIATYRQLKAIHAVVNINEDPILLKRKNQLITQASLIIDAILTYIPDAISAQGFYEVFACGFLPVPTLYNSKEAFPLATALKTKMVNGGVDVVDVDNQPMPIEKRIAYALTNVVNRQKAKGEQS